MRKRRRGLARIVPARRRTRGRGGSRKSKKKTPTPLARAVRWTIGVVGVLVVLSVAWLLYTSLRIRGDLHAVRAGVHTMRAQIASGDLPAARKTATSIRDHADNAASLTGGPVWAIAANVPLLGDPFATTRGLTTSVHTVAQDAVVPLIDAIGTFQPDHLRTPSGAFNLAALQHLVPTVGNASNAVGSAVGMLRATSGSTWLGPVNSARDSLISDLTPLQHDLRTIHNAVAVVPTALGAQGPRTYMISFQNDAEIRATGGIPGAFAVVRADHGRLNFARFEPDNFLINSPAKGLHLGGDYFDLFQTAQEDYRDSNYSPNFPYAGQIWSSMYQRKTGQQLDGALIIDPTALKYMLAVVGPVRLADGVTISAANVVQYTQQTLYARFPQTSQITERKNFLLELARAVSTKLLTPGIDSGGVLHAAGVGASQGRLLFWSRDANVERELQSVPLGGVVPDTKQPYVGLALNNDSQSKLDYYLHTSMQYASSGCGGTRDVTVTVTFTNDAPQNLPRYVIGNSFPKRTETLDVYLYGSVGARFTKVTSGGVTPFHLTAPDRGHPVYYASINVPPGRPTTVVYHLTEPASNGPLIVRDQPMVNPMTTTVSAAHCR